MQNPSPIYTSVVILPSGVPSSVTQSLFNTSNTLMWQGASAANLAFQLGASAAGNNGASIIFAASNTSTNWQMNANSVIANCLTWTPSTVGGGTTFSTPVMNLTNDGTLTTRALAVSPGGGVNKVLTLGVTQAGDDATFIYMTGSNAARNWQQSTNAFASGELDWTPSTALGGTTFTTPVMRLNAAGTLTATTFSGSGASLTNVPTTALTGTLQAAQFPALTGDVTTVAGALATTLATVNANVGTFGSATAVGVFTVNAKGLITAASNTTVTPAVGSITGLGTGVATALGVNVGTAGAFVVNGGALGTPASGTLTNTTGFPIANLAGAGTGVLTALAVNVGTAGAFVVNGGALGTPSSGTLTNTTGFPIANLAGAGTGVLTALAVNVGSAGAFVTFNGALGTPSSGTLTNTTGFPASSLAGTTLASGVVTSSLTTVGALDSGSITSGFGSINVGADAITGGAISGTTATFSSASTHKFGENTSGNKIIQVGGTPGADNAVFLNLVASNSNYNWSIRTNTNVAGAFELIPSTATGGATFSGNVWQVLQSGNTSQSGSATAVAFIPSGSTVPSNGMYLPAANTLNFATSTTARMQVKTGVSIGTTTDNGSGTLTTTDNVYFVFSGSNAAFSGLKNNSPGAASPSFITSDSYQWVVGQSANGTGAFPGNSVMIGRNTSGNGAPGFVQFIDKSGGTQCIWSDSTGVLRIGALYPTETGGDTTGTVVGTQTSTSGTKNILGLTTIAPSEALGAIVAATVYDFTDKAGKYNHTKFTGLTIDDSPWIGMDPDESHPHGRSFNPVTAHGYTVLAIKALEAKLRALEQERIP